MNNARYSVSSENIVYNSICKKQPEQVSLHWNELHYYLLREGK